MKKKIDCVEMKRRGAEKVCEAIQGMTVDQEVAYWRKHTKADVARNPDLKYLLCMLFTL